MVFFPRAYETARLLLYKVGLYSNLRLFDGFELATLAACQQMDTSPILTRNKILSLTSDIPNPVPLGSKKIKNSLQKTHKKTK
jgi:hypothetical protein